MYCESLSNILYTEFKYKYYKNFFRAKEAIQKNNFFFCDFQLTTVPILQNNCYMNQNTGSIFQKKKHA